MYVERLKKSSRPIKELAAEVYERIERSENSRILDFVGRRQLRESILRHFLHSAEAIDYPLAGRKHSGQSPCLE